MVVKPRESSRGPKPSRTSIVPGGVYAGKVACPKGKQVASRPAKRNRRFRLVAPGADFFGAGACPPRRKIASLQIPRPEIQRISAESEKGWCGGESVPSASGCAREVRSPLDFQSKGFPQEILRPLTNPVKQQRRGFVVEKSRRELRRKRRPSS